MKLLSIIFAALFSAAPAHAGLFDDDEARRAILDLRMRTQTLADQLSAAQRTILNQSRQIEQLQQQLAQLRGQQEILTNQLGETQRAIKDHYAELDARLKKFEPHKQTVDGMQGAVQPGEADAFNAALDRFRTGGFNRAVTAFKAFIVKYPRSPYQPTAQYWLGNALYAQRDYRSSTAALRKLTTLYPAHPRAPDALLAIAQNQLEQGQKSAARKTLQQIISRYSHTEAARSAQRKLTQLDR